MGLGLAVGRGIGRGVASGVSPATAPTLLLDTYAGAVAAYGLKKLKNSYGGSAFRVRRSSDDAEQDIGFVDGTLDTASLESFCGAGNGFIVTFYDQSGGGRDVTQSTAASQCRVVTSGSYLGYIVGNASGNYTTTDSTLLSLPGGYDFTVIGWTYPADASGTSAVRWDGTDDLYIYPNDITAGTGGLRVFWRDLGGNVINYAGADISGSWNMVGFTSRAADDHEGYENDASVGTSSGTGTAGPFSSFILTMIGFAWRYDSFIVWSGALSDADIAVIHGEGRTGA